MKKSLAIITAATLTAAAAPIVMRGFTSEVSTARGMVCIKAVDDGIIRISRHESGKNTKSTGISVLEENDSLPAGSWISPSEYELVLPSVTVKVDRTTGRVCFIAPDGHTILSEAVPDGKNAAMRFVRPDGEHFYGAGERGHRLVLNGDSLTFYNRPNYGYGEGDPRNSQMNISIPWVVSDAGYGILFDDYGKAVMTLGDTLTYTTETPDPVGYYFISGGDMPRTVASYSRLTGLQPLPPLWALGYITSKYGYHDEKETLGVVDTLKNHGYPLDGLVLDLYWYGKETDMGRLEWNKEQFPDHRRMIDSLRSRGVNTVIISQPYVNKIGAIDNYNLLDSLGMLTKDANGDTRDVTTWVGEAGMLDITNPDTRQWLWRRMRALMSDGLAGLWGDLGEPEQHPVDIVHASGESAEEFHNAYGNRWSQTLYEGLRADFPEMRPFLMMRGGSAGLQRYGVFPWTSDVARSWEGLQPQVRLMLQSGLSGLGYMSSDIGGFAVNPDKPEDAELYVRWLQMGVFTPMLRTHAQNKPEPFHYQRYEDILKRYIDMRYEWLPYNYTLAYENAAHGLPLVRPVFFNSDTRNDRYAAVDDEYLWGDNVLVAPVMKKGATSRKVLFPAGEWVDFFNTRLRYKGMTEAIVKAPLSKLPLFVKAGSFIPLAGKRMENTTGYDPQLLTVRYYPSPERSRYVLFDDNRSMPGTIENNAFQLTTFEGESTPRHTLVNISASGAYDGMPEFRQLRFEIPGVAKPRRVDLGDGDPMPETACDKDVRQSGWTYDAASRTLTVIFPWAYTDRTLKIEY